MYFLCIRIEEKNSDQKIFREETDALIERKSSKMALIYSTNDHQISVELIQAFKDL